jgi:hypothetical protein
MPYKILDEVTAPPEGSFWGNSLRNTARTTARGVETLAGLGKDIPQGLLNMGNYAQDKIQQGIESIPVIGKTLGSLTGESRLPKEIPFIPGSADIKKYVTEPMGKYLPKGYLEPQGKYEKLGDEYFSDLVSLFAPGGMTKKAAAITSGVGNLSKFAAKEMNFGEGVQSGVKTGSMLLTSLLGIPGVKAFMKDNYEVAEALLPEGLELSMKPAQKTIGLLKKEISRGGSTGSKDYMLDKINQIESKTLNGKMKTEDVWGFKKDASEWMSELKDPKRFKKLVPNLQHDFNQILEEAGQSNPEFLRALRVGDNIYKGLVTASPLSEALQKYVSPEKVGMITGAVLLGTGSPLKAVKTLGAGIAMKNVVKGIEALKNSSEIRKYYLGALAAAAKKNGPAVTRMVSKMDEKMSQINPENKGEIVGRYKIIN